MADNDFLIEACEELADKIKSNNTSALEIAEVINRVGGEHTIPSIRKVLRDEFAVDIQSNGTISKWLKVHLVFVQRLGISIEDLSPYSIYKLYAIREQVTEENCWELINATLDKTIKEMQEESGEPDEKASIVLNREVFTSLDHARQFVGFDCEGDAEALSMEAFLAFTADLFLAMEPSQRQALYGLVHGEHEPPRDESEPQYAV